MVRFGFIFRLWLLLVVGWLVGCSGPDAAAGMLEGQVTVGPLSPVEQAGVPEPAPPPEVYTERKVMVYAADGQELVSQVDIDGTGHYHVTLPVGVYVVDINHLGIDYAKGLPQQVTIERQQTTRLDIDIDTGIR